MSNEALFTGFEANPMNQAVGKKVALLLHFLHQRSNGAHQAVALGFEQQATRAQRLKIIGHAGHPPRFLLINQDLADSPFERKRDHCGFTGFQLHQQHSFRRIRQRGGLDPGCG